LYIPKLIYFPKGVDGSILDVFSNNYSVLTSIMNKNTNFK
jgi:hypothetical protein